MSDTDSGWLGSPWASQQGDGQYVRVLGYFDTLAELEAAHPKGHAGDFYIIHPDSLYTWDQGGKVWVYLDEFRGPKGDKGDKGDPGPPGPEYILEPATKDTLGGIKVGKNLTISSDGTLDAEGGEIPTASIGQMLYYAQDGNQVTPTPWLNIQNGEMVLGGNPGFKGVAGKLSLMNSQQSSRFTLSADVDGELNFMGMAVVAGVIPVVFKVAGRVAYMGFDFLKNLLPIAAKDALGGIKVGKNLTISADGTLDADAGPYELPIASKDKLGGIKVGKNLDISADGTLNADLSGGDYQGIEPVLINNDTHTIGVDQNWFDARYDLVNQRLYYLITGDISELKLNAQSYISMLTVKDIKDSLIITIPQGGFPLGIEFNLLVMTDKMVQVQPLQGVSLDTQGAGRKVLPTLIARLIQYDVDKWALRGSLAQAAPYIDVNNGAGSKPYNPEVAQPYVISPVQTYNGLSIAYFAVLKSDPTVIRRKDKTAPNQNVVTFSPITGWAEWLFYACYINTDGSLSEKGNVVEFLVQGNNPGPILEAELAQSRGDLNLFEFTWLQKDPPPITGVQQMIMGAGSDNKWFDLSQDATTGRWCASPWSWGVKATGIKDTYFRGVNNYGTGYISGPFKINYDVGMNPKFVRFEDCYSKNNRVYIAWLPDDTLLDAKDTNTEWPWNTKVIQQGTGKVINEQNYIYDFFFPKTDWDPFGGVPTPQPGDKMVFTVSINSYGRKGPTITKEITLGSPITALPSVQIIRDAWIFENRIYGVIYDDPKSYVFKLNTKYFAKVTALSDAFPTQIIPINLVKDSYYGDIYHFDIPVPHPNLDYVMTVFGRCDAGDGPESEEVEMLWHNFHQLPPVKEGSDE